MAITSRDPRTCTVRYAPETVISSCPGLEDVILWRALHDVKDGFFVDIGAGDPNAGSPTRWFSVNGWTGVNLEPNPMMYPILSQWRPKDINLNFGISNVEGSLKYYNVIENELRHGWGLSTFDPVSAAAAMRLGYRVEELNIQTMTLDHLYAQFCPDKEIDFLKIDVEGYEKSVILSSGWKLKRPKILCIEATAPLSTTPSFSNWEEILLKADYTYVMFDGVNNYYVRNESSKLLSQFNCGINAGDKWRPATREDYKEPWL